MAARVAFRSTRYSATKRAWRSLRGISRLPHRRRVSLTARPPAWPGPRPGRPPRRRPPTPSRSSARAAGPCGLRTGPVGAGGGSRLSAYPASASPLIRQVVSDRLARPIGPHRPGHDTLLARRQDRDRRLAARQRAGGDVAQQPAARVAVHAQPRRVDGPEREGAAGDRHLVAGAHGPAPGGMRNRTSASAASPNRRSRRSSRSPIALSSPSVRTPPDRRALIVVARSGSSPTGVPSGCRAVQPRPVTDDVLEAVVVERLVAGPGGPCGAVPGSAGPRARPAPPPVPL